MNSEVRNRGEGTQIGELTSAVIRVAWVRINQGCEISDAIDGSSLAELLAQRIQVEPAIVTPVGAVAVVVKAAVIEIEPVDVDIRPFRQLSHSHGLGARNTQGRPEGHPCTQPPKQLGTCHKYIGVPGIRQSWQHGGVHIFKPPRKRPRADYSSSSSLPLPSIDVDTEARGKLSAGATRAGFMALSTASI